MNSELNTQLLQTILDNQKRVPHTLSLTDMGITEEIVNQIYEWAKPHATEGELASYIPELARVDANKSAIVIGDLLDNQIVLKKACQTASLLCYEMPFYKLTYVRLLFRRHYFHE